MDCIEILKKLVQIDTTNPPGNEKMAAEYLAGLLEPFGFQCEIQDMGNRRANLIAVKGKSDGPELMLNGHLDVVPAIGEWETDAFQMTVEGDRLYGRGTADMKGGIAAMCEAAMRVAADNGPKHGRLKLLFVADEECSNLGTRNYLDNYKAGQYAVIGEPTNLQVAIAHRGVSRDYIDIYGVEHHAALPATEEDSVFQAVKAMQAIQVMNQELQDRKHEVLPPPGISVTMIQGYEKDNVVPGNVRLLLDFRILPEMNHDEVQAILKRGFDKAGIKHYKQKLHFFMPGGELKPEDSFVKVCLEEVKQILNENRTACAFDASCEQCFFVKRGIRTIICGPGDLTQAHTVGEYTSEVQVRQAADLYERIIERILG